MVKRTKEELQLEWKLTDIDHVGSRVLFFFQSVEYGDSCEVRVVVSRTHKDPEAYAWEILDNTVK